jgi:acyl carrier protein|tara:strand:+ start:226 stop:465 length:240 start_codon:yes stop_codon:yes gene_type:complete
MSKKVYEIISRVMNVPLKEITDQSGPETIETWDSFNGLVLVDDLEAEFNISFTLDEVIDVKTISDIKRHLTTHGVLLDD